MLKKRVIATSLLGTFLIMGTSSCMSIGTNIRGNFTCRAPNGTCAPSMMIDDAALAQITGSESRLQPAVERNGYTPQYEGRPQVAQSSATESDRVLRITFPAHVDEYGNVYEARSVRVAVRRDAAVVVMSDPSRMREIMPPAIVTNLNNGQVSRVGEGEMVAVLDAAAPTAPPPGYPSPEAVASARARVRPTQTQAGLPHTQPSPVNQPERFSTSTLEP